MKRPDFQFVSAACIGFFAVAACTQIVVYDRPSDVAVEHAFVKKGVDLGRYQRLMSSGLEIYYPSDVGSPPEADLQRMRQSFRAAFLTALGDDYVIVTEPGRDVLLVRAQLIDMKVIGREGNLTTGGLLREMVARGELTFIMEMVDSITGEVLVRAGDTTRDISNGEGNTEWAEVDAAAKHWAGLFRAWLDRSLKQTN